MNDTGIKHTARTPIAIVSERFGGSDAFITYVVVKSIGTEGVARVNFKGVSVFTEDVQRHIKDTIVPIVDDIVDGLAVNRACYDISISNLPTASVNNGHIRVEGFSADLPVFTAMLAAAMDMPLTDNILTTGHIGSCCGEIMPVKALESKLHSAINDSSIQKFIYPDYKRNIFSEYHDIRRILADAVTSIKMSSVSSIYDCIEQAFEPHQIVLSALRKGYFERISHNCNSDNSVVKIISYLSDNNLQRFWNEVRTLLMTKRTDLAKELFAEFCRYYISRQKYSGNAGSKLSMMTAAVPRHIRGDDKFYPLCDIDLCIKMGQYADRKDHHDFVKYLNCITGTIQIDQADIGTPPFRAASVNFQNTAFDEVLNKLNQKSLATKIDIPIDSAQGSFVPGKAVVNSYEEFLEITTNFVVHFRCHVDKADLGSLDVNACRNDALDIIEKAFKDQGGCQAAYMRASEGIDSGIRGVFNKMVDQYKFEQKTKYANRILKETVDIMSWDERVDFMRTALTKVGNLLPTELRNQPPERFAREFEVITKAIIKSLDKVNDVFSGY